MFRYLELCVDLKKSHVAKEGLFQYRNMCQSTNVASLASVVQGYLNMAEKRTESARQESADSVEVSDEYIFFLEEKTLLNKVYCVHKKYFYYVFAVGFGLKYLLI